MRIGVFGGTGPTGQLIVRRALAADLDVVMVARSPEKVAERHPRLSVRKGDVHDASSVAEALQGVDIVVSSLGVPYTWGPVTVYSAGMRNILAGMQAAGVRRVIAISSGGTHVGRDPNNPLFFEWLLKPFFGKTLYADMRAMEELLMASAVDWTLLRPSRLVDTVPARALRVGPDVYSLPKGSVTPRDGLAAVVIQEILAPTLVRKGAAVAT